MLREEGILDVVDRAPTNADHVKSAGGVGDLVFGEVSSRQSSDRQLFGSSDSKERVAAGTSPGGLHLEKDQDPCRIACDAVDFSLSALIISRNDRVAVVDQPGSCTFLAGPSFLAVHARN